MADRRAAGFLVMVLVPASMGCSPAKSEQILVAATAAVPAATGPATAGARPPLRELPAPAGFVPAAPRPLPVAVSAAQHPGHSTNQAAGKALPVAAAVPTPPGPPAEVLARQAAYLAKWQQQKSGWTKLTPDEQEGRRAALKQAELGQ